MARGFTPTGTRRAFHHGALPADVIRAARTALERDGAADLSLRGVAKATGVYPAAVSHHFGDREGLLAALAIDGFEQLIGALEAATGPGTTAPADGVRKMLEAYLEFARRHPAVFAVMFSPWSMFERRHAALEATGQRALALLRDQVARWAADAARADVDIITESVWCTVHGLATMLIEERAGRRRKRFDVDAILGVALRPLGRG